MRSTPGVGLRQRGVALGVIVGLLAVGFGTPPVVTAATTRNVPAEFATITAALAASSEGDTVLVAPGTYTETITVPFGITVESSGGADVTIIDGNHGGPATIHGTLRGVTLQNHGWTMFAPGGALVYGLIEDSRIVDNGGCAGAAGVHLQGGTIRDNYFQGNEMGLCTVFGVVSGDGVIQGNFFDDNTGLPAIYMNNDDPLIEGNVFMLNGKAIDAGNTSVAIIRNNLFIVDEPQTNFAYVDISTSASSGTVTFVHNTLVLTANGSGHLLRSGRYDAQHHIANNIFVGPSGATLVECETGGDNQPPQFMANDSWTPTGHGLASMCSTLSGTNDNVSVDPKFTAPELGDFHLRADSPLIDAAADSFGVTTDIDGDTRPHDGDEDATPTSDMGMDEAVDPLLLSSTYLDYGSVPLAKPKPLSVTLQNLGGSSLTISSVAVTGTNASDFALGAETCTGGPLGVGAICTIPVTFTPSALGPRTANLDITGPGDVGTRTLPLIGVGTDPISIAPSSFQYPDTVVGAPAIAKAFTVTNSGGVAVTISSVAISGANAADVTIVSQTCTAAPIATDGTCTINTSYRAKNVGERVATLVVSGASPVGTRNVALTGYAEPPPSGISLGTVYAAGPPYTWNGGSSLARTVQSGTQRLHVVYSTNRIGTSWASDSGARVGVYYTRSTAGTTSWTTGKRLSATTYHAARQGVAAAGAKVYAIWVSQTKWVNYSNTAARRLYVRVNTNHGDAASWRSALAITNTTERVDYPVIAATGTDAHIAYTAGSSGTIWVASSRDGGLHWAKTSPGSTTIAFADGKTGFPTIAAAGSTVVVCWLSDVAGTVKCRVSTNRGVSWGTTATVGIGATGYFSVAARGTRIAVAWPTDTGIVVAQRISGVWGSPKVMPISSSFEDPYGPVVALQDPNRISVTWADLPAGTEFGTLFSMESSNGGTLWYQLNDVGRPNISRMINDWPSIVWPSAGTRYIVWNGWTPNTTNFRLYIRKLSGTPSGPALASRSYVPGRSKTTVGDPSAQAPAPQPQGAR